VYKRQLPRYESTCSGVCRFVFLQLTSAPSASRNEIVSGCFCLTAKCRGEFPESSLELSSRGLFSRSDLICGRSFFFIASNISCENAVDIPIKSNATTHVSLMIFMADLFTVQ
jgi:hypothetical protein